MNAILRKIQAETSTACLMALRTWAEGDDKWTDAHQTAYAARVEAIKERRK